jgi:hypothetical protein
MGNLGNLTALHEIKLYTNHDFIPNVLLIPLLGLLAHVFRVSGIFTFSLLKVRYFTDNLERYYYLTKSTGSAPHGRRIPQTVDAWRHGRLVSSNHQWKLSDSCV